MREKIRCQTCARELSQRRDLGTKSDGLPEPVYCRRCFQDGSFRAGLERMSMEEFSDSLRSELVSENVPEDGIAEILRLLPTLIYWRYRESKEPR